MSVGIRVTIDEASASAFGHTLREIRGGLPRATRRAITKTLRSGEVQLNRAIREEITLSRASVDRRINTKRKPTEAQLSGEIEFTRGRAPSLTSFKGARWTKKSGVRVQVRQGQPAEVHPHAFIRHANNAKQVFERPAKEGGKSRRARPGEERVSRGRARFDKALISIKGPTPLGVFEGKPGLKDRALQDLQAVYIKTLGQEVNYELIRRGKRT